MEPWPSFISMLRPRTYLSSSTSVLLWVASSRASKSPLRGRRWTFESSPITSHHVGFAEFPHPLRATAHRNHVFLTLVPSNTPFPRLVHKQFSRGLSPPLPPGGTISNIGSIGILCIFTLHDLRLANHTHTLYTLHFTLPTLYFALHALHSKLYTPHFTPTLHALHFTYTSHFKTGTPHSNFTLDTPHSTFYLGTPHSALHTLHFTLHNPHSTLYTSHATLYTLDSALYTLHSILCTLHFFTLFTLRFTLDTWHCTVYNLHFTL